MKKLLLVFMTFAIGLSTYAQKTELKAAEKALNGGDVTAAKTAIDMAEKALEEKNRGKFYFLKAKTYYDLAKKNPASSEAAYTTSADSFQKLIALEKKLGKFKYTKEAEPLLNTLISDVSQKSIEAYQKKDYDGAKKGMYQTYMLSKSDTVFLEYAANSAYLDQDYDTALKHFTKLKELGYSGIETTFSATNVETGEKENFGSKQQMDLMVKAQQYKDPTSNVSKSKKSSIIKNIALILADNGKPEEALAAIEEARRENPNDMAMLISLGNIYLKLDKKDEFAKVMQEAISQDPNNPTLYFNLGVISQEQGNLEAAKENYKKAIELDANYVDGYRNLAAAMLEDDKALVEEMNNNLSNFKKYDAIKAKQVALYKEVIPLYEKSRVIIKEKENKEDLEIVRILMSLYENIGDDDKYKEMKVLYDASKE